MAPGYGASTSALGVASWRPHLAAITPQNACNPLRGKIPCRLNRNLILPAYIRDGRNLYPMQPISKGFFVTLENHVVVGRNLLTRRKRHNMVRTRAIKRANPSPSPPPPPKRTRTDGPAAPPPRKPSSSSSNWSSLSSVPSNPSSPSPPPGSPSNRPTLPPIRTSFPPTSRQNSPFSGGAASADPSRLSPVRYQGPTILGGNSPQSQQLGSGLPSRDGTPASAVSSTTGRFNDMAHYSPTETTPNHPGVTSQPTSPAQNMSPNSASLSHIFNSTTANRPFGNEIGMTGQTSPGGRNFETGYPIEGKSHFVDMDPFTMPGDTNRIHSHPARPGSPMQPSGDDHRTSFLGRTAFDPPQKEMVRHTPQSNGSGVTYQPTGTLNEQGQGRWHQVNNPYNMGPITEIPGVGYKTPIPTNSNLLANGGPPAQNPPSS